MVTQYFIFFFSRWREKCWSSTGNQRLKLFKSFRTLPVCQSSWRRCWWWCYTCFRHTDIYVCVKSPPANMTLVVCKAVLCGSGTSGALSAPRLSFLTHSSVVSPGQISCELRHGFSVSFSLHTYSLYFYCVGVWCVWIFLRQFSSWNRWSKPAETLFLTASREGILSCAVHAVFPIVLRNGAVWKKFKIFVFLSQLTKIKRVKQPILAISVVLPSDSLCFITGYFFLFFFCCDKACHMASVSYLAIVNADQLSHSQRGVKINRRNKWPWPSFTTTLFDPWGPDAEGFHCKLLPVGVFRLWCFLFVVLLTKDVISAHPITWHQSGNTDGEKEKKN